MVPQSEVRHIEKRGWFDTPSNNQDKAVHEIFIVLTGQEKLKNNHQSWERLGLEIH